MTKNATRPSFLLGVIILIFANIGFSSKAVIIKLMYRYNLDTISVLAMRMLFSLPIFIIIALILFVRKDNVRLTLKEWLAISGLGILSYYISSWLDFTGLQFLSASVERLILFTYPTIVVLISAFFLGKKITIQQKIALLLTYIGVAIAFVAEKGLGEQKNIWLGSAYVFACAITYSFYVVGTGELVHRFGSIKFSCYAMIAATMPILIQCYAANKIDIFHFTKEVYFLSFFLVLIATIIPIFLIVEGIRIVGASNSSIIGFVGPMSTIFLGYIFLNENVSVLQLVGTAIVLAGVYLVSKG